MLCASEQAFQHWGHILQLWRMWHAKDGDKSSKCSSGRQTEQYSTKWTKVELCLLQWVTGPRSCPPGYPAQVHVPRKARSKRLTELRLCLLLKAVTCVLRKTGFTLSCLADWLHQVNLKYLTQDSAFCPHKIMMSFSNWPEANRFNWIKQRSTAQIEQVNKRVKLVKFGRNAVWIVRLGEDPKKIKL